MKKKKSKNRLDDIKADRNLDMARELRVGTSPSEISPLMMRTRMERRSARGGLASTTNSTLSPDPEIVCKPQKHPVKRVWLKQSFLNGGVSSDDDEDYMYSSTTGKQRESLLGGSLSKIDTSSQVTLPDTLDECLSADLESATDKKTTTMSRICRIRNWLLALFILAILVAGGIVFYIYISRPLQFHIDKLDNVFIDKSVYRVQLNMSAFNPNLIDVSMSATNIKIDLMILCREMPTPNVHPRSRWIPPHQHQHDTDEVLVGRVDKFYKRDINDSYIDSLRTFTMQFHQRVNTTQAVNLFVQYPNAVSQPIISGLREYTLIVRGSWTYQVAMKERTFRACVEQTIEAHVDRSLPRSGIGPARSCV